MNIPVKYQLIITLGLGLIAFVLIRDMISDDASNTLANDLGILAFLGSVAAWWQILFLTWLERRKEERLNERITIILKYRPNDDVAAIPHELAHRPRRGNFTRAELQGVLGTAIPEGNRYDLPHLNTGVFAEDVARIADPTSRIMEIEIPYTKQQFTWDFEEATTTKLSEETSYTAPNA